MIKFIYLFLVVHVTTSFSMAPPMKIPLKVNGSFCEYRESHFHGGIDLSTQKITGHEILSVASGTLYRVKDILHGEGKALYIRHQNGDISVYAHLESFSPKVQEFLSSKELPKVYDIFPSKLIQFHEGEVIGFSGESGAGFPHLHFEIRSSISKSQKRSMYLSGITDHIPPKIREVYLVPFKKDESLISVVDGKLYKGSFGIAVKLDDRMDGSFSKCSIYRLRLKDNNQTIYSAKFDTIHYGKSPRTQMHFVPSHTHLSPTQYVYKMYKDFDKGSSYITALKNDGVLGNGRHHLEIEVEDFFGNITKQSLQFKTVEKPQKLEKSDRSIDYQGNFRLSQSVVSVKGLRAEIQSYKMKEAESDRLEIIKIAPEYLFFINKARLTYNSENVDKLYLSKWDSFVKKWKSIKTNIYPRFITSDIRNTGIYSVKKDLYPPFLAEKIYTYKGLRLQFDYIKASDTESGVNRASLKLLCNKQASVVDYDSDRNWIRLDKKSSKCNEFTLKVCDNVGNCTSRSYE